MDIIRAEPADADRIAEMGMRFIERLKLDARPPVERVAASVRAVLSDPKGAAFLAVAADGTLAGFLIGLCVPVWFDVFDLSAIEMAWWMDPEHRGGSTSVRLVGEFERWAATCGVRRVVLADVEFADQAHPAGALIERLGYTLHERAFVKVI